MKLAPVLSAMIALTLPLSCNKSSFQGDTNEIAPPKQNAPLAPESKPGPTALDVIDSTKTRELIVTTPVTSVKSGEQKVQATARLKGQSEPPRVTWTITGPTGTSDIGTIDDNGLYTSPKTNAEEFKLTITASLKSDPKVSASTTLGVLPIDQIFARCAAGSSTFPILAHVYSVPSSTTQLPDYGNPAQATKITTVCMEKYAVEPRPFASGFPDVKDLFEYFSLQTTTQLVIQETGSYTFELNSDDGARLYIDGKEIIENDGLHRAYGPSPEDSTTVGKKEVTLTLSEGIHPLTLNYFQGPKFRIALVLKWKTPGSTTFEYVPRDSFR